MMKKTTLFLAAAMLATAASPAHAQFGGLASKVPGLGGGGNSSAASAGDIDTYLNQSREVAIAIGVSSVLLKDAKDGIIDRAASGATVRAIRGTTNAKEASAALAFMKSDDAANKLNVAGAEDLERSIAAASSQDRAVIGAALLNLALSLPRAIKLAQEAPGMIKSLGSSPSALGQVGKLKDAGGLLALQVKYTADILPILPRLMSAAKVKMPANAETSKVTAIPDFE